MRKAVLAAVTAGTLVALVAGVAVASSGGATAGAVVKTRKTSLGTVLVNAKSLTLYMFMKDKNGKSACSGQCATFWPPLVTSGKPTAGAGAKASLLGTTRRAGGKVQVTYKGHPLYRFAQDTKAGQTNGEGVNAFGAHWYAVSPAGAKVLKSSSGGGYGGGGYGGYGG